MILLVAGLSILLLKGFDYPFLIYSKIQLKLNYISKQSLGDFANIGISISEQDVPGLKFIINSQYKTIIKILRERERDISKQFERDMT